MRARCYRELGLWQEALAIYEALGDIEVNTSYYRILGRKVSVKAEEMEICRAHLGEERRRRIERGTLGAPVANVPDGRTEGRSNSPAVIAARAMIGRDLWIGCRPQRATYGGSRRKDAEKWWGRKGGLCRYDAKADRLDAVALDESAASEWITSLEPQGTDLWVGTFGGGLTEGRAASGQRLLARGEREDALDRRRGLPRRSLRRLIRPRDEEAYPNVRRPQRPAAAGPARRRRKALDRRRHRTSPHRWKMSARRTASDRPGKHDG